MRDRARLLLAALASALALAVVGEADPSSLVIVERAYTGKWASVTFEALEGVVRCPLTLEGTFADTSFSRPELPGASRPARRAGAPAAGAPPSPGCSRRATYGQAVAALYLVTPSGRSSQPDFVPAYVEPNSVPEIGAGSTVLSPFVTTTSSLSM